MRRYTSRPRWIAGALSAVLLSSLLGVSQDPAVALAAGGPSVELPGVPSVPVQQESRESAPPDQTSGRDLSGDQLPSGAAKDGGGMPTATSLSPSATWTVSAQSGDFSWSYPLRVPPTSGGLQPNLAFSYSSSAVDGRTSATNNQPSWVGDGWELGVGFVERSYGGCADDKAGSNPGQRTNDLCWRSDNAVASYDGGGGMLIRDAGSGNWRPQHDDGARVERDTGAGNGDNNGEYWKITTVDGTQYFYGSRADAKSTWSVPVYGDDSGEPCNNTSGFDASSCRQAWRWNLDKVIDARGNMMLFDYEVETNSYGANMKDAAVPYDRGGTLRSIRYGLHTQLGGTQAPGRVELATADRCVPGSSCTFANKANWPDTALSELCDTATCPDKHAPTFWSTKRLASVTTQVSSNGSYTNVDRWTLDQSFPSPGDGEQAALWLKSIVHTGLAGGSAELPPVTFAGRQMANRVFQGDNLTPLIRYRIAGITSEAGGVISINYAEPNCVPGSSMPANPETNTLLCFPVRWAKPNHAERTDYFHRYVVESVVSSDQVSSSVDQKISYEYLGGAAWHYDTSEFTPPDKKTWNEFRGFGRVRIRTGLPHDPSGSPIELTEQRFFRGMHADTLPAGGSRNVSVPDSEGGSHVDHDWLNGVGYESITYQGESSEVVTKTLTTPVWQGPTATRDVFKAHIVRPGTVRTLTALDAGRGRRETKSETTYDDRGLPSTVSDHGDVSLASDDLCTRTTYARNTLAWILDKPSRVQTVSVHCGDSPTFPEHAVSDQLKSYDAQAHGTPPTAGLTTTIKVLDKHPATGPVYVTGSTATYDLHGRVTTATDALNRTTRTEYTPATGGPVTKTVVTGPMGYSASTEFEPTKGKAVRSTDINGRVTETSYDPLGRATEVWLPDRPRTEFATTPHYRFSYQVRRDAPNVVTTTALGPNGRYVSTNALYDGMLRLRQTQQPAVGGGRLLSDVRYDSHGRNYKETQPYFNDAAVDTDLWRASDTQVPGLTVSQFDGAGRETASRFLGGATEKWRSTMSYGGDRVYLTPPAGGIATTTVSDARGRTTELRQHRAATPSGPAETTSYRYTPDNRLALLTDAAGNQWSMEYDLRGRAVQTEDPDKGPATATYDAAGQLKTQTDARGQVLAFEYDKLGRRLAIREDGPTGRLRSRWTYDAPGAKGQLASATSYDADGDAYVTSVEAYNPRYLPLRTSVTLPESEGPLAGTYTFRRGYGPDGVTLAGEEFPQVGDPADGGLFGEEVFYTYDDSGRPETTYGGPEGTTVWYVSDTEYTRYGEVQRIQLGSGTRRAWQSFYYDPATRQVDRYIFDAEVPKPMQADLNYEYDPAGNITSVANTPIGGPADVQCFRYDHQRRLTEAWTPGNGCAADPSTPALSGPAPYWQSFSYDAVGNRLGQIERTPAGITTRTYAHAKSGAGVDRPHAPKSVVTKGVTGLTTQTSNSYDAAGYLISRGGQQFGWDAEGHLAAVDAGSSNNRSTFVYGATGERLVRRDPTSTTLYLGDQEIRVDRGTGAVTGSRYYTHGGEVVAVRTPQGRSWLATDHHGTAQIAVNSASLATTVRRHDPFGNPRGPRPANWPGDRGFVGGTVDPTGLTHLGAREYDSTSGRFISVDPVLIPGDPQQLNAYAYAGNSPITFTDPDGLRMLGCGPDGDRDCPNPKPPAASPPPSAGGAPSGNPGCDGRLLCSSPSAHDKTAPPNPKLFKPALGHKPDPEQVQKLRDFHGYKGSDDFTWYDALEFAGQGVNEFQITCLTFGMSHSDCGMNEPGHLLEDLYDLTPVADFHHCFDGSESCWWIATNLPFGKFVKVAAKAAETATDAAKVVPPNKLTDDELRQIREQTGAGPDIYSPEGQKYYTAETRQPPTLAEEYWRTQQVTDTHKVPSKSGAIPDSVRLTARLAKIVEQLFRAS